MKTATFCFTLCIISAFFFLDSLALSKKMKGLNNLTHQKPVAQKGDTFFDFHDDTAEPINFQVWTAGTVFYVTGCDANPRKNCNATVDCVWYDLLAINMNNKIVGKFAGAYCGGNYCLAGNDTTGPLVLGSC